MKRLCAKCKIPKELNADNFSRDKYDKTGFTYQCKVCRAVKQKEWVLKNPHKAKEANDKNKVKRKEFYDSPEGILSSRRAHLKRNFNLTLDEYNSMLDSQNGKCMICGGTEMNNKNKVLCVDHDHKTGKIRGLLCGLCNSGLGKFRDNKQFLENAIKYLI